MVKYVNFVLATISAAIAIVTPLVTTSLFSTTYSYHIFILFRFRYEIAALFGAASILFVVIAIRPLLQAYFQRFWNVWGAIGLIVYLPFLAIVVYPDGYRFMRERILYLENGVQQDYQHFLTLAGDSYYARGELNNAIGFWNAAATRDSREKSQIATRRIEIADHLYSIASNREKEIGPNIASYFTYTQAVQFSPLNEAATRAVKVYLGKIDTEARRRCANTPAWVVIGYQYSIKSLKIVCDGNESIFAKWYTKEVADGLRRIENARLEHQSLIEILGGAEKKTFENSDLHISSEATIKRLTKRLTFRLDRQDFFIKEEDSEELVDDGSDEDVE